jgi:hypothetical protein
MTDRVLVVTHPDDVLDDCFRLLLVDLTQEQLQTVSNVLTRLTTDAAIITYIWNSQISTDWLIDKKHKSQWIIYNAESNDQAIVGYLTAQRNSSYFGTPRSLKGVNKSTILSVDQCQTIIETAVGKYEQTPK